MEGRGFALGILRTCTHHMHVKEGARVPKMCPLSAHRLALITRVHRGEWEMEAVHTSTDEAEC